MSKKTLLILAILAILFSALIKFYLRNIVVSDAQELLDFLSGFLLGVGVLLPFKRISKKDKV